MPANDPLSCALFLILGLALAGLAHSAWLRAPVSRAFLLPLDCGLHFRGRRLLGANKTVRGFMVMVPAAAVIFAALAWLFERVGADSPWSLSISGYAWLGALAAFGLMAGELPNSFVKRQLDIAPGTAPSGRRAAAVCFIVDRLDSILGMLVAVTAAVGTPWQTWAWVILLGSGVHWSFSVLLYTLGVKERPA